MDNQEFLREALRKAEFTADYLRDMVEVYIGQDVSIQRLNEDAAIIEEQKKLMDAKRPDWEKQRWQSLLQPPKR
jgi:uncharacterized protein YbaP (TraB family)